MTEAIQNNVSKLRKEKGQTQEDLAKSLGITRQTVIAIEKGSYTPSLMLALKVSKFFKKNVEEIFQIK